MAFTQDFFTSRRNYGDGQSRIGDIGRLWYDSVSNTIRVSDGSTPGGLIVSGGGGGGIVFDGGSPTTIYTAGPAFDCGGVT